MKIGSQNGSIDDGKILQLLASDAEFFIVIAVLSSVVEKLFHGLGGVDQMNLGGPRALWPGSQAFRQDMLALAKASWYKFEATAFMIRSALTNELPSSTQVRLRVVVLPISITT